MLADTVDRTDWKRPVNAKKSPDGPVPSLETVRCAIDLELRAGLDEASERFSEHSARAIVDEVARATLPQGGRIRPLLCCCSYAACGGEGGMLDRRIVAAAASLELLHTFALLHDDVMDGALTRRGAPATHIRAAQEHRQADLAGDHDRYGTSVAILAGDLALVLSDLMLASSGFNPALLAQAAEPLGRMRLDAIAGQFLDLTHTGRGVTDAGLASRIARLKTAGYSVEGPLMIGATLAGGSGPARAALGEFARPLGEAFQIIDDLLGMFGDPAATGKSAENDLREGKPTLLMTRALAMASPQDRDAILSVWGQAPATAAALEELRLTVARTGALRAMIDRVDDLLSEARGALQNPQACGLEAEPVQLLIALTGFLRSRADRLHHLIPEQTP